MKDKIANLTKEDISSIHSAMLEISTGCFNVKYNFIMFRFYMIKMVECFAETIGITLSNLGIDTDKYQLRNPRAII